MTVSLRSGSAVVFVGLIVIAGLAGCHSGAERAGGAAVSAVAPGGGGVCSEAVGLLGDLDGNGQPGVADAIGILRMVVGLQAADPIADVDGSGAVGIGDAIALLRCVVGLDGWPVGVASEPIGPEGGTTTTVDGAATLQFPAGSLAAETDIAIYAQAVYPVGARLVPGTIYELAPDGTAFTEATLSIRYDRRSLPAGTDESTLALARVVDGAWAIVPGSAVDQGAQTVSGAITGFSTWGIVIDAPPQVQVVSFLDEEGDIWSVNSDGTGLQRQIDFSSEGDEVRGFDWRPDGQRIAYGTWGGVWTCDPDGAGAAQVSELGGYPRWSPDGARIAIEHNGAISIINADGSGLHQIYNPSAPPFIWAEDHNWSTDGTLIGFSDDNGGVWVLPANGSAAARKVLDDAHYPAWSPDGQWIAFNLEGIRLMPGQLPPPGVIPQQTILTTAPEGGQDDQPAWSPAGDMLAFERIGEGGDWSSAVMVVNADGSGLHKVANGSRPDWRPNGL
ncbi:MAG TPA: hypothetical protein DGT21_07920 [Armatimonadetes bacterium]|nr:hypothetical protein [Armatimonadota bacterium]